MTRDVNHLPCSDRLSLSPVTVILGGGYVAISSIAK
jgi:hypothetical protein